MKNPDEHAPNPLGQRMSEEDDTIVDLHDIARRLGRGLGQIIGLALLGLAAAAVIYLVASTRLPVSTSTRIMFAFPGFAKGEYPDQSIFNRTICALRKSSPKRSNARDWTLRAAFKARSGEPSALSPSFHPIS